MIVPIYNLNGEKIEEKTLPAGFSEIKISKGLIHEVVIAYLANQRKGNACAKTKAEVSGGGAKPWNQKGTGRARQGSTRSPLFRGGGVVFGPKPRSYRQDLPKNKLISALKMSVKSKIEANELFLIRDFKIEDRKTKRIQQILDRFKIEDRNTLLVIKDDDKNIKSASKNISCLETIQVDYLNAYMILWAKKIIFTEAAFNAFDAVR